MTDETTENENSEVADNADQEQSTVENSSVEEAEGQGGEGSGPKGTELYAIAGIVVFLIVIIFTWPTADERRSPPVQANKADIRKVDKNSRQEHELRKRNAEKYRAEMVRQEPPVRPEQQPSMLEQLKSGLPDGAKVGMVIPYERLQTVKKSGDNWQGLGATVIQDGFNAMVAWDKGVTKAEKINISFDNNDHYSLSYENGTEKVGSQTISRPPGGVYDGLQQMLISVPRSAVEKGYDKVIITPSGGDKLYSIGHFVLINPTFTPVEIKKPDPNKVSKTAKTTNNRYKKPQMPTAPVSIKSPKAKNENVKEVK